MNSTFIPPNRQMMYATAAPMVASPRMMTATHMYPQSQHPFMPAPCIMGPDGRVYTAAEGAPWTGGNNGGQPMMTTCTTEGMMMRTEPNSLLPFFLPSTGGAEPIRPGSRGGEMHYTGENYLAAPQSYYSGGCDPSSTGAFMMPTTTSVNLNGAMGEKERTTANKNVVGEKLEA